MDEKICIVMSTFNGERYLSSQIDSIINQQSVEVRLIVRDDGSTDNTSDVLKEYKDKYSNVEVPEELSGFHNEEGIGSSFFKLLRYAYENTDCDYFGFSDQDDVWDSDKLTRAISQIKPHNDRNVLYFSKTRITNDKLEEIEEDPLNFQHSYCDYLSPNDAAGCTMVINRNYAEFILQKPIEQLCWLHDVLLFRIALCTDCYMIYDEIPSMNYRQHSSNVEGVRKNVLLSKSNIHKAISKKSHKLTGQTNDIISFYGDYISIEYGEFFETLMNYRSLSNSLKLIKIYNRNDRKTTKEKIRFLLLIALKAI